MVRLFNPVISQIIIFSYCSTGFAPMTAPSTTTLMAMSASSSYVTTIMCHLDPYIISFCGIFIRESLINCIHVICELRVVGHVHGGNAHLHHYGRLHKGEKVITDIFIEQIQL